MILSSDLNLHIMNFSIDFRSFLVSKESNWIEISEFCFDGLVIQRVQIISRETDLVVEFSFSVKLVGFF